MKVLKLINNKKGFKFDDESKAELLKLKDKENINLEIITEKKYRSLKQNNYYWEVILNAIRYFLPESKITPTPKSNKELHDFLMFGYGVTKGLLKIYKYKDINIPIRPSWKFAEMTQDQANDYLEFLNSWCERNINYNLDYLTKQYEKNI